MLTTTVVNIRHNKADVYCGRGSIYGNPFLIGRDGTRDDVCEKFKKYFRNQLSDPNFYVKVMALKGKTLGCYCKPLRCHVDIIKEFLDNVNEI